MALNQNAKQMQNYNDLVEFAKSRLRRDYVNAPHPLALIPIIEDAMALGLDEFVAELEEDMKENEPNTFAIWSRMKSYEKKELDA